MIYLDNSSTTKPDEKAVKAAISAIECFGNPSSPHGMGTKANLMLSSARKNISSALKCSETEIFFTSGGSESNNTLILGLARKNSKRAKRVVTTDSEHPSVAETVALLEKEGFEVIRLSTKGGVINADELREALSKKTSLVTVMHANNETGALYDIAKIREVIDDSECGAYFHSDCVQSFMKTDVNFTKYCDAVSFSAHKIGGIKGCGGIFLKKDIKLDPFIRGGGQERGFRSGTENMPGIMAFSAAVSAWNESKKERNAHIFGLKKLLSLKLLETFGDHVVINTPKDSVCSVLNFSIPGIKSETVINALSAEEIYVSASSACSARAKENSILSAFGLSKELSESALRVGISYFNTEDEILEFCKKIEEIAIKLLKKKI